MDFDACYILSAGATGIPGGIFDMGANSIWLTNLNCTGAEANLLSCPTPSTIGITGCLHAQDAGVICDPRLCKYLLYG